jgi:RimJ/RimL family protein N-acetyltransferase
VKAWVLTRPGEDKLLGTIGLPRFEPDNRCTSISFELRRDEWGPGLLGAAAAAIVKHAFEDLKLHRIQAEIDPKNAPSIHLAESLGFRREGILRENVFVNGAFSDTAIYALFNPK